MLDLSCLRVGFCFLLSAALYPVTALGYWLTRIAAHNARMYRFSVRDIGTLGVDLAICAGWALLALVVAAHVGLVIM